MDIERIEKWDYIVVAVGVTDGEAPKVGLTEIVGVIDGVTLGVIVIDGVTLGVIHGYDVRQEGQSI